MIFANIPAACAWRDDSILPKRRRFRPVADHRALLWHLGAIRFSNRDSLEVQSLEAHYVHAEVIWGDSLAMKGIDSTMLAEVMPRRTGVKSIFRERWCAS